MPGFEQRRGRGTELYDDQAPLPSRRSVHRPTGTRRPPTPPEARPRPGVPVTTGQNPIARVRAVPPGPTGTAPIPVAQPAPRVPTDDPRLRRAPRPEPRPEPEPPVLLRPALVPPAPASFGPAPAPGRRRRALPTVGSMLAVLGLLLVTGLPAIAAGADDVPPPIAPLGVQHFEAPAGSASKVSGMDVDAAGSPVVAAPTWQVPVHGDLRDGFGPRPNAPVAGVSAFHRGQDVGAPCGTPVHASAAGRVVQAGWWGTYGNWVMIDHGNGVQTGYAHLSSIGVRIGQVVRGGQVVAISGSTGASTGCHVHVEVHLNGVAVDPVPFYRSQGAPLGP